MATISPIGLSAATTAKFAVAVASTAATELPKHLSGLYFVTTTTACYILFGAANVASASATVYTLFLPAGFAGVIRAPGTFATAIRDSADGTLIFTAINDN
jgi:hypothetical protein